MTDQSRAVADAQQEQASADPVSKPHSPASIPATNHSAARLYRGLAGAGGPISPLAAGNAAAARVFRAANDESQPGQSDSDVVPEGAGQPLPGGLRERFERRLGEDLGDVRVHTGPQATAMAEGFAARAYTVGRDIVMGAGSANPDLLAHEVIHTVQSGDIGTGVSMPTDPAEVEAARLAGALASDGPDHPILVNAGQTHGLHRVGPDGGTPSPGPTGPASAPGQGQAPATVLQQELIPPEWVRRPNPTDLLIAVAGDRMLVMPAAGNLLPLEPPQQAPAPASAPGPVLALPTVAKESVKLVRVGDTTGFLIDAGGKPNVVVPGAMAAMSGALGVTDVRGVVITHLHDDHVNSLVELVTRNRIRPENLHYPESFAVNVAAPSSDFARAMARIQADPALQALGHSPTAAYGRIATPTTGDWFHLTLTEGEVTFDMYGLSAAFRELQARRARGDRQANARVGGQSVPSIADTASLLVRATHRPSGLRILFLSDLRFSDLTMFQTAMGDASYREMLTGVRVVEGLGHHMGAMNSAADRTALAEFLQRTQMINGRLTVMAQSEETRSGKQFVNRSLIDVLAAAGVEVHVAMEPAPGGAAGVFTVNADGTVTFSGPGNTITRAPDPQVRADIARLVRLREVEQTLTRYGRFLTEPELKLEDVRAAREQLEQSLNNYMSVTAGNVAPGEAGRRTGGLADPAAQSAAASRLRVQHPIEAQLLPATMDGLTRLRDKGPHLEVLERAFAQMRTTGEMPKEGIDALWELEPEVARRLVAGSGMSRSQQRATMAQLPGAPAPIRVRVVAGALIVVELVNLAAPVIQAEQARAFDEDVRKGLGDIMWWEAKGVLPKLRGVNDRWWPRGNLDTTERATIQTWINDKDIDFLVMTSIEDKFWDAFTIWATAHLTNYRDWEQFVSRNSPLRVSGGGSFQEQTFEYRVGTISETTFGWDVGERWERSDRLDRALQASADRVVTNTNKQIGDIQQQPGDQATPHQEYRSTQQYHPAGVFEERPQATGGKRKFRQGVTPVLYTVASQVERTGYSADAVFLVFPTSAAREEVPSEYVVVGGGNFNTYSEIYRTNNLVTTEENGVTARRRLSPNTLELLLAKAADLEPVQ